MARASQPMRGRRWSGRRATELTAEVLAVKGRTCHLCGQPGADTADHLVPRVAGGPNTLDNLAPAHQACNSARQAMTLPQWFATHPLPHRDPLPPSRPW